MAESTKFDPGVVQLLTTLITVCGPTVIVALRERTRKKEALPPNHRGEDNTAASRLPQIPRGRDYLSLTLVLLCSAFLSSILTDSLVVSGQNPSFSIAIIFETLAITALMSAALVYGWYMGRPEFVMGMAGAGTLTVLLFSRGGFLFDFSHATGGVPGLNLFLPLALLTVLIGGMVLFLCNPLSPKYPRRRRAFVAAGLGVLVLLCTIASGSQMLAGMRNNPLTPKAFFGSEPEQKSAEKLLASMRGQSLAERGYVYRLASEIALSATYRDAYFRHPDRQVEQAMVKAELEEDDSSRPKPADTQEQRLARAAAQTGGSALSADSRSQIYEKQLVRNFILGPPSDTGISRSNGDNGGNGGSSSGTTDTTQKVAYLADRTLWTHPVVLTSGPAEIDVSMPGATLQARFYRIAELRANHPDIRRQGIRPSQAGYYMDGRISFEGNEQRYWDQLFPPFPSRTAYSDNLLRQFALGAEGDAYVTYTVYLSLVRFLESMSGQGMQDAHRQFIEELPHRMQRAFITYVAAPQQPPGAPGGAEVFRMLADLSAWKEKNSSASGIALADAPSAAIEVAGKLKNAGPSTTPRSNPGTGSQQPSATSPGGSFPGGSSPANSVSGTAVASVAEQNALLAALLQDAFKDNEADRQVMISLLEHDQATIPLRDLLTNEVLRFARLPVLADSDKRAALLSVINDPVRPVVEKFLAPFFEKMPDPYRPDEAARGDLSKVLAPGTGAIYLGNLEILLHHIAIATYRPAGDFSLDAIDLFLYQASAVSPTLASVCAFMLTLPIFALSLFGGSVLARKLYERDRSLELLETERLRREDLAGTVDFLTEMHGRESLLTRLAKLSGRGWSTIAVVGRRGIGKSRLLHELYRSSRRKGDDFQIATWMSAPASFNEEDFIESTLEQLAYSTESAVAAKLGADPYPVRRLSAQLNQAGLITFMVGCVLLASTLYIMIDRLGSRREGQITWIPILFVVVAGIVCLVRHFSLAQPVDLSSWLERDRSNNAHAVLLYRRTREVINYLHERRQRPGLQTAPQLNWLRAGSSVALAIAILWFGIVNAFSAGSASYWYLGGSILLAVVVIGAGFIYTAGRSRPSERGSSLMALVSEYRTYATAVVYRLENNALGPAGKGANKVMICVDELDKIVALREIRAFLRRMKAIFEIPGVYYYLSLSEDTMAALYLGPAGGKNEVDSALDHIVRIEPLSREECKKLVADYLERRSGTKENGAKSDAAKPARTRGGRGKQAKLAPDRLDPMMEETISALSFGVPRDALRRCDEALAFEDPKILTPARFIAWRRKEHVAIAAEAYGWKEGLIASVSDDSAARAIKAIEARLQERSTVALDAAGASPADVRHLAAEECRVMLLLWVLAQMEATLTDAPAKEQLDERLAQSLDRLYRFGYDIIGEGLDDLLGRMDACVRQTTVHARPKNGGRQKESGSSAAAAPQSPPDAGIQDGVMAVVRKAAPRSRRTAAPGAD